LEKDRLTDIRWELPEYTRGKVLHIAGKLYRHFIHVNDHPVEIDGRLLSPDVTVKDVHDLRIFANQSFDAVVAPEVHAEYWRVIRPGGHLCVTGEGEPDGIWDCVSKIEGLAVYKKLTSGKCRESYKDKPQGKTALVYRCGAFGDMMQASSVWAGLKKQGYHVTVIAQSPGADVITHDPNIDRLMVLDRDQVPNVRLVDFWNYQRTKFDKFVNLSESVEGAWLALPNRANHEWPVELRRKYMTRNYVEFQHELAGLPHDPQVRFYPTPEETEWARKQRAKMGAFVALWSLSGSSVHKHWPYLDQIIARLFLSCPEAHVVLVGGPECEVLETGWESEPRVHRMCGKWSIRQSLAFIEFADLVIGPETGVLNAASHRPVPKVLFLSHSPKESLSRDWVNCESLTPPLSVHCYPCLRLHHNWSHCWKDEEAGAAMCQSQISADTCWAAVEAVLANKFKRAA
jgi:ADP-heptose:LPS heptosyltransferase